MHAQQSALPLTTDRNRILAQTLIEPSKVSAVQLISHTWGLTTQKTAANSVRQGGKDSLDQKDSNGKAH